MNAHGMMEYQISLEDAVLKGSKENILEVDQVLSTFQIRFNNTNYQADAYNTCFNNTFFKCSDYLFSNGKALSKMREWTLKSAQNSSETR